MKFILFFSTTFFIASTVIVLPVYSQTHTCSCQGRLFGVEQLSGAYNSYSLCLSADSEISIPFSEGQTNQGISANYFSFITTFANSGCYPFGGDAEILRFASIDGSDFQQSLTREDCENIPDKGINIPVSFTQAQALQSTQFFLGTRYVFRIKSCTLEEITDEVTNNNQNNELEQVSALPSDIVNDFQSTFNQISGGSSQSLSPTTLIRRILTAMVGILGAIVLAMVSYGGFVLFKSRGNSDQVRKGAQIIGWTTVGVVVTLSSVQLVRFLFNLVA